MSEIDDLALLSAKLDVLAQKINTLRALCDQLRTELIAARGTTSDAGVASALSALVDKIDAATASVDTTVAADTPAPTPVAQEPVVPGPSTRVNFGD